MLHKTEVKEWLKHPVTKAFQEALRLECQAQKEDLANSIDNSDLSPEELHLSVTVSRAARYALLKLADDEASDTIISMLSDHNQLEEEKSDD